ncbi:hypothetical protein KEM60_03219 [Austwickia sp. TVS 96-490-7B]|nr:hypothetical protein [Austwickia sp. TVS 96-490-7B]
MYVRQNSASPPEHQDSIYNERLCVVPARTSACDPNVRPDLTGSVRANRRTASSTCPGVVPLRMPFSLLIF